MQWEAAYLLWEQDANSRRLSPETLRTWRSYLRRWSLWCRAAGIDPIMASHREVKAWISEHPDWSASSHKSARMALGSFYRLMVAEGVVKRKRNPMLQVAPVPQKPGVPRPLPEEQVRAGLDVRNEDVRLMVALCGEHGLRRSEVARLRREDIDSVGMIVRGKGDKKRWVPITDERVARALLAKPSGWIFPGKFSGHVHPGTVARWVKDATGSPPHPLRHRFATVVYDGSGDLLAVRDLLGHRSTVTTEGYVALAGRRLRAAAAGAWAAAA